uniref:Uncharacterized protein n=1 Tax=Rhizophora mucronata TaxID=61149 RepID=A0A2P2NAS5_RHIMU
MHVLTNYVVIYPSVWLLWICPITNSPVQYPQNMEHNSRDPGKPNS